MEINRRSDSVRLEPIWDAPADLCAHPLNPMFTHNNCNELVQLTNWSIVAALWGNWSGWIRTAVVRGVPQASGVARLANAVDSVEKL